MTDTSDQKIKAAAHAIMKTRVTWGWTFGKRHRVLAIDLMMAEAALKAVALNESPTP